MKCCTPRNQADSFLVLLKHRTQRVYSEKALSLTDRNWVYKGLQDLSNADPVYLSFPLHNHFVSLYFTPHILDLSGCLTVSLLSFQGCTFNWLHDNQPELLHILDYRKKCSLHMLSENFLDFILWRSFDCLSWVQCRGQQIFLCVYLWAAVGLRLNPHTWTKNKQHVCPVLQIPSPSGTYKMERTARGSEELDLQREKGTHQVQWDKEIKICDWRV